MGNIITKENQLQNSITDNDRTILQLKLQRDRLKQHQVRLSGDIEKDRLFIRSLVQQGQKKRAVVYLRKQKFLEKILERTDDQLINIEQVTDTIEFAQQQSRALECLKAGTKVLSMITEDMKKIDVEQMRSEFESVVEFNDEVAEAFSTLLDSTQEADVELELESLEKEFHVQKFPIAPTSTPAETSTQDSIVELQEKTSQSKLILN